MSDETPEKNEGRRPSPHPGVPEPDDTPRRSAGAAASRARRIGGRVPATGAAPATPEPATPPVATSRWKRRPAAAPAAPAQPGTGATVVAVPDWLRWAPAGALTAAAAAMVAILLVFSHGVWWSKPSGPVEREKVLAAAKTCVVVTNSYKYAQLDAFETQALACATGQFRTQLKSTIDKLIKVNAPQLKASQRAQINRGGIETLTSDGRQWTVLLFGQLAVTNTNYPKGRTDPFAAQVRMEKVHGKWVMSDLKTVSTPLS
jgi:hypothetical protein